MENSDEPMDVQSNNSSEESDVDLDKVCFICLEVGDPISDKLKNITANVLSKSIVAIETRNKLPRGTRKSLDWSKIKLPASLQENRKYHQSCFRDLTNVSGKKRTYKSSRSIEDVSDISGVSEMPHSNDEERPQPMGQEEDDYSNDDG